MTAIRRALVVLIAFAAVLGVAGTARAVSVPQPIQVEVAGLTRPTYDWWGWQTSADHQYVSEVDARQWFAPRLGAARNAVAVDGHPIPGYTNGIVRPAYRFGGHRLTVTLTASAPGWIITVVSKTVPVRGGALHPIISVGTTCDFVHAGCVRVSANGHVMTVVPGDLTWATSGLTRVSHCQYSGDVGFCWFDWRGEGSVITGVTVHVSWYIHGHEQASHSGRFVLPRGVSSSQVVTRVTASHLGLTSWTGPSRTSSPDRGP